MSTVSQPPTRAVLKRDLPALVLVREMWGSLAIFAMWTAVAVSALWGPDFVSTTPGSTSTTIPSGIAVALFATIGTWAVAKYAFGRTREGQ
jgi:hypothetical protein